MKRKKFVTISMNVQVNFFCNLQAIAMNLINSCFSASPCDRNAKCLNTDGSFTCKCKQDFAGDGFKCKSTLVDEEGFRIPFF